MPHEPTEPRPDDVPHELLLNLFNSVTEGVIAVDRDQRVTAINRAALQALGLTWEQAADNQIDEILVTERGRGRGFVAETLAGGRPLIDRDVVLEDSRGRQFPVVMTTDVLRAADGRLLGAAITIRDLTRDPPDPSDRDRTHPFRDIVTGDPNMRRLFGILPTIARADSSLLVLGETGTGKSLLVRTIHGLSPRRRGALITVNCAALPETLLEAELFGVKAGAYTGAVRDRPGRLEAADGGTLFLDEIGDIPPPIQVKLLRVLQERVYERLGDVRPRSCDVRFIAATHRDLSALVEAGSFRRDLYYRINVLSLEIPPLRDRKADIPLLAQRFLDRLAARHGKRVAGVSSRVFEILTLHDFPGNIRELENIVEHAFVMCDTGIIQPHHLPRELTGATDDRRVAGSVSGGLPRLQADHIRQVLRRHGGNRGAAARELGIHRTTLQRQIRRLGIELPPGDGRSRKRTGAR